MPKRRLCVGVDIGASSIKLCQLERRQDQFHLAKLASHPLPPETIVDGALMSASRVVEALRALFSAQKIRDKKVAVAISGHSVIIKKLTMPQMGREELEASIALEAETLLPFDIKDVYFDVQVLPSEGPVAAGSMQVLFVAAKKDYVHEYTSVLEEAGLTPVVCDVDPFALETTFLHGYAPADASSVALVNVGAAKTTLNIMAGRHSGLTRELTIGGNTFTEGLQRALKISFEQAERYKLGQARDISQPQAVAKANASLIETTELLADELQASFEIFGTSDARGAPKTIYLAGGSTHMPGLEQSLKQRLHMQVEMLDPLRHIETQRIDAQVLQRLRRVVGVAVGLSMRWPGDC